MRFSSETTDGGVTERRFTLDGVPGVLWSPAGAVGGRPLVLQGHGGGQHKLAPGLVQRARRWVAGCGFAVAGLDAPGHGERPRTAEDEWFPAAVGELLANGEPIGERVARHTAALAERAVPEWRAVLDALQRLDEVGADGPVGYWGLSLASVVGVPLAAAEPRITAAVFGLAGHGSLDRPAARVDAAVEFVVQWDDELVPREAALALFDAFGTRAKVLHANPGGHLEVPAAQVASSARALHRHLTGTGA
ncbi:alpha/beta hydrolase [Kitasatospora sp. NPDC004745]|uniref:alpha/beta hydrolase n=1 Tax=Kitasatospora sp. NPDC004745 TaxID=3364019 RepID=UPI0036C67785